MGSEPPLRVLLHKRSRRCYDEQKHAAGNRNFFLKPTRAPRMRSAVTTSARVKRVSSRQELKRAFAIRLRVFVKEQGVRAEIEMDRDDQQAVHLLAFVAGRTVGTSRVVIRGRSAKIGRMAVLKKYRGKGIGKMLLKRAVLTARRKSALKIYLHAQAPVIGFYESMGFRCTGPLFTEAGIPHRTMILTQAASPGSSV
jgi:predicted GNAT family N-acyltransferase